MKLMVPSCQGTDANILIHENHEFSFFVTVAESISFLSLQFFYIHYSIMNHDNNLNDEIMEILLELSL